MTIAEVVVDMTRVLGSTDEARELLALLHDQPRHWPSVARDERLSAQDVRIAMNAATRRATGMPLQYAARRAAFRHFTLDVDERVLIPRPETELLVDIVLDLTGSAPGGVAVDVGTGSGAIALALASEGHFAQVIATDVSLDALAVARANVDRLATAAGAAIELRHGSLLGPVPERGLRAIVSNPPYIAFEETAVLPSSVRDWEPAVALYSARDGMAATARLVREAAASLAPAGVLALETDYRRAATVADLAASHGAYADVRVLLDLTGRERFVVARRREE
ncbi:MAG: peptide chain release factor N(5)-glutamine methyltransferase [bacterium]